MKIFSILAIVPCLSLQVAYSPVEISPLGSDEGIAAKFQKVESDSTHDHQLKRRYAPYPQPYGQQLIQPDQTKLHMFAEHVKKTIATLASIVMKHDSPLSRKDHEIIKRVIMKSMDQLQFIREALNPHFTQPPYRQPFGQYAPPSNYPAYGTYGQPTSYPAYGTYGQPTSYPAYGTYGQPTSYPAYGAYGQPASHGHASPYGRSGFGGY
ncbi:hypothetical protein DSO57_1007093 [Entomophthora muscae]|uniref:Uncharacterized protein n=1 Tax=Entomophthora muscae TaxID=34485 RepID=A0ACC2TVZ2_9FUNG|nr:hypothetical protein DSO57_1007093 [Entomophthora muscae]